MEGTSTEESDANLAALLQSQYFSDIFPAAADDDDEKSKLQDATGIVSPEWETLDPTPDLHALFLQFNDKFFWSRLSGCEVKWSPRMTLCAGVCSYQRRAGYCSIRLSVPLLKLRPRKDLVETLLHEMIHAYLFVTDGDDDHDGHGPAFHKHMYRINKETGTNISVYHTFHDEVDSYRQHWWRCDGPCQQRKPFFGIVKRSMNRAPGPNDLWWKEHESNCGGTYSKIKEPDGYGQKKRKAAAATIKEQAVVGKGQQDIRSFIGGNNKKTKGGSTTTSFGSKDTSEKLLRKTGGGNIFGFGGCSFDSPHSTVGLLGGKQKSGTMVVNPGWKTPKDNSAGGSKINSGDGNKISVNLDSSPSNVRQRLRDVWANRFTDAKPIPSSSTAAGEDEESKCPVCDESVPSNKINEHLDKCLSKSPSKSNNPFVNENSRDADYTSVTNNDEDIAYPCPVCAKKVLQEQMNSHLDLCVGIS